MPIKPNQFVENLSPYVTTSQEPWVAKNRKLIHKMDWNEGPRPNKLVKETAIRLLASDEMLSWYPDCNTYELTDALSEFLGVSGLNILTFPGSDVALETVFRSFLSANDNVVVLTPTYEHVFVYIASMGGNIIAFPLEKPYLFDLQALIRFLNVHKPKSVYMVRPNNPCGYMIDGIDILNLCHEFPDILFIADEAYIEFSDQPSLAGSVCQCENLIVLRTFSKAFSLAGVRIGYMVANHQLLEYVSRLRNGKNISMLGQLLAIESLKQSSLFEQHVIEIKEARNWLCTQFSTHGIKFFSSHGNFVLFEIENPKQVVADLKIQGIYIRDRSNSIEGCIRVTITDRASTELFWHSLKSVANK